MNLTLDEITKIVDGQLIGGGNDDLATGACIDSRKAVKGCLFFALPGERVDGHDYILQAHEAGAAAAVVTRIVGGSPQILVRDSREALQQLAAYHRSRFDIPVIAVTGSVGKTTTKDLLAVCLEGTYNTLKTSGNYNNELGLPLTLLQLTDQHQACVVELGMSAPGEIDLLGSIARPTASLIVNAEAVHLESMGSIKNIAKAKCEVLEHTRDFAVINGDSAELKEVCQASVPVYWFGKSSSCEWKIINAEYNEPGTDIMLRFGKQEITVYLPLPAMHLAYNTCAAIGTALLLGVPAQALVERLKGFVPSDRRMKIVPGLKNSTIIDDCYNANPQSMAGALRVLKAMARGRRTVAVLGDMFELGDYEFEGHRLVGKIAAEEAIDLLVAIGEKAKYIVEGAEQGGGLASTRYFGNKAEAIKFLAENIKADDIILVKASRGMRLEDIVDAIVLQEESF